MDQTTTNEKEYDDWTFLDILTQQARIVGAACDERMSEYTGRAVRQIAKARGEWHYDLIAELAGDPTRKRFHRRRAWLEGRFMMDDVPLMESLIASSKLTDREKEVLYRALGKDLIRKRQRARLVQAALRWARVG